MEISGNANIWIVNAMTIGIVLVIMFVFRFTDVTSRDKRNISKQTARAIQDIQQVVSRQEQKINDILLRIRTEEESLMGIYEKFHGWSKEVSDCRTAINSVADATRNADTNLEILEKKGQIVEQLRTELEKVSRERVAILDELSERNKSAVDALGISVLNSVQLKLSSIKGELDAAEMQHTKLKSETTEIADRTKEEIKRFSEEHLGKLDLLMEKSRSEEETLLAELKKESTDRIQKTRESIESGISGYRDSVAEKLVSVEKLLSESRALEESVSAVRNEVENLRQNASEEAAGRISAFSEKFVSDIRSSYEGFSSEYSEKLGALSERIGQEKDFVDESTRILDSLRDLTPAVSEQLSDVKRRMEWIAGTETRMLEQIKKAEELISLLGGLTGSNPQSVSTEKTAPDNNRHIQQLIEMGWDNDKIREKLGVSESEISFVRDFNS